MLSTQAAPCQYLLNTSQAPNENQYTKEMAAKINVKVKHANQAFEEYQQVLSAWARLKNILPKRHAKLFKIDTLPMLSFFAGKVTVLPMRSWQTNFATSY
jgi:hypothetical protein